MLWQHFTVLGMLLLSSSTEVQAEEERTSDHHEARDATITGWHDPCLSDADCGTGLRCSTYILGYCILDDTNYAQECQVKNLKDFTLGEYGIEDGDSSGFTDVELNVRDQFLDLFKPCGWYHAQDCPNDENLSWDVIHANMVYPGQGNGSHDLNHDVTYLTRFDVGIHRQVQETMDGWVGTAIRSTKESEIEEQVNKFGHDNVFESVINNRMDGDRTTWTSSVDDNLFPYDGGEACFEIPTTFERFFGDNNDGDAGTDWGQIFGNGYGCMGFCGGGCGQALVAGDSNDCMKHDVCSAFKSVLQGSPAGGFCFDVDCGDEGAQTITNCYESNWGFDEPIRCDQYGQFPGPDAQVGAYSLHANINGGSAFIAGGAVTCGSYFQDWSSGQGMPQLLKNNGSLCLNNLDCDSLRCDWFDIRRCADKLESGAECNEHSDCYSNNCQDQQFQFLSFDYIGHCE